MPALFHPLLALIASATDRELAKYVEYLKQENKILRARIPGVMHTRPEEHERLLKYGMKVGRAIEELVTIVTPGTFYRWVRDAKNGRPKIKNPKGGQRKPREIRELVIQKATVTGFGYTRIIGELRTEKPATLLFWVTCGTWASTGGQSPTSDRPSLAATLDYSSSSCLPPSLPILPR